MEQGIGMNLYTPAKIGANCHTGQCGIEMAIKDGEIAISGNEWMLEKNKIMHFPHVLQKKSTNVWFDKNSYILILVDGQKGERLDYGSRVISGMFLRIWGFKVPKMGPSRQNQKFLKIKCP